MLDKLVSLGSKDGPGKVLGFLQTFKLLPPDAEVLVSALDAAPMPQLTKLDGTWLENLDTLAHVTGCLAAGYFEALVDGLTDEEVSSITREDISEVVPDFLLTEFFYTSFETMKSVRMQKGSPAALITQGKIKPEGMMTHVLVAPFIADMKQKETDSPKVKLKPGVGQKSKQNNLV